VKTSAEVIVALPSEIPPREALGLAKLVLDNREYAELSRKIGPEAFVALPDAKANPPASGGQPGHGRPGRR